MMTAKIFHKSLATGIWGVASLYLGNFIYPPSTLYFDNLLSVTIMLAIFVPIAGAVWIRTENLTVFWCIAVVGFLVAIPFGWGLSALANASWTSGVLSETSCDAMELAGIFVASIGAVSIMRPAAHKLNDDQSRRRILFGKK